MTKQQRFTKLYKFLFTDANYSELPTKAKLLYALLTERQNLSKFTAKKEGIQSQYIDDDGRLFSIYTNHELVNKLHMSEPTIIKLKKHLIQYGLLEEVRMGHNISNRLYPKKPYDEYFYVNDIDEFYRLPHALFENKAYRNLSPETVVAYAVYLSRYEYSVYKKHFSDKNNEIYCHFSNENMAELLNVSTRKVERIKNQLVVSGLMVSKRSTFGKASKLYIKLPKRWYSKELKICRYGNLKSVGTGTKNLSAVELKFCRTSYTYFSYTYSSDTDISDMNNMNEDNINVKDNSEEEEPNHSNNTNHCSTPFSKDFNINQVKQEILLQQLPNDIQINLKHFSNDEISCIKGVLNKAKANHNYNAPIEERITYEDCSYEIGAALKRIKYYSIQRNENIKSLEAYMMQSFKRVFADYIQDQYVFDDEEKYNIGNIESFVPQNKMQAEAKRRFLF
ncbi:replication initiator protein A [Staphylococcus sp. Marseille-Q6910]|uniref:replication initiator protein A n=1 Tax=Staphylococcus sp. Marseille-Q6910 TaxID=2937990 RepID=UPI00203DE389|nr:replication initiator protein A [Staphylococcus sp. Marseille-Q6910]